MGAINVLGLAKRIRPKYYKPRRAKFMGPRGASSTGNILGNVNPVGKRACYDEGKRCAGNPFYGLPYSK